MHKTLPCKLLLIIPALTYVAWYIYLGFYHGRLNLINTVVHEGGTLTLWETTFYASHFIGHIPVYVVASFLLLGSYFCLAKDPPQKVLRMSSLKLFGILLLFLLLSFLFSLWHFGAEDTFAYIGQRKQGVDNYVKGGSWNLHLGSTMMLFLMMPLYVYVLRIVFARPLTYRPQALWYFVAAGILLIAMTWLANGRVFEPLLAAWMDPRYLAHSVRELATFPLTYFPLPLYFIFRAEHEGGVTFGGKKLQWGMGVLFGLFAIAFAYQALIPMHTGIGGLAQCPSFAKEGELSIPYLLSAHYFEHFMDSLFFALFTLLLYPWSLRRVEASSAV